MRCTQVIRYSQASEANNTQTSVSSLFALSSFFNAILVLVCIGLSNFSDPSSWAVLFGVPAAFILALANGGMSIYKVRNSLVLICSFHSKRLCKLNGHKCRIWRTIHETRVTSLISASVIIFLLLPVF